jgi:hypothetical protein
MRITMKWFKAPLVLTLSLLLLVASSLNSFASLEATELSDESIANSFPVFQDPTGTVTVVNRDVSINGSAAKVGQTVMTGSLVRTGTDSHLSVEISSLGRADYGRLTESVLTMSGKEIQSSMNKCGSITLTLLPGVSGLVRIVQASDVGVWSERKEVDVRVTRGQVLVKYGQGKEKVMTAGDHREFDNAIDVSAVGDAVFSVYCHEDHVPLPLLGLGALGGAAALLIPGGDETPGGNPISQVQP